MIYVLFAYLTRKPSYLCPVNIYVFVQHVLWGLQDMRVIPVPYVERLLPVHLMFIFDVMCTRIDILPSITAKTYSTYSSTGDYIVSRRCNPGFYFRCTPPDIKGHELINFHNMEVEELLYRLISLTNYDVHATNKE